MRTLARILAALLIAIPVCIALLIVIALEARRTTPLGKDVSHSFER
jgi:hypothetical protein